MASSTNFASFETAIGNVRTAIAAGNYADAFKYLADADAALALVPVDLGTSNEYIRRKGDLASLRESLALAESHSQSSTDNRRFIKASMGYTSP